MTDNTNNVVGFKVQPKIHREKYRNHTITVYYRPDRSNWYWEFEYVPTAINFNDTAPSEHDAVKAAKKKLDSILGPSP